MNKLTLTIVLLSLYPVCLGSDIRGKCTTPDGKTYPTMTDETGKYGGTTVILSRPVKTTKQTQSKYIEIIEDETVIEGDILYIRFRFKNVFNEPITQIFAFVITYDDKGKPIFDKRETVYFAGNCKEDYPLKPGYIDNAYSDFNIPKETVRYEWYINLVAYTIEYK